MKKRSILLLTALFFPFISNADEGDARNINILNQYALHLKVEIAPHSQLIKAQNILTKDAKTGKIAIKQTISSDAHGYPDQYITEIFNPYETSVLEITDRVDAKNKAIHHKRNNKDTDSTEDYTCYFEVDEKEVITQINCPNDQEKIVYDNGKISSSKNIGINDLERWFNWNNGRIHQIKGKRTTGKDNEYLVETNFTYDSEGKIIQTNTVITQNFNSIPQKNLISYITTMTEFNQYGDWIKAEIKADSGKNAVITREITYY